MIEDPAAELADAIRGSAGSAAELALVAEDDRELVGQTMRRRVTDPPFFPGPPSHA